MKEKSMESIASYFMVSRSTKTKLLIIHHIKCNRDDEGRVKKQKYILSLSSQGGLLFVKRIGEK